MNFSNKLKICAPSPARTQSPKTLVAISPPKENRRIKMKINHCAIEKKWNVPEIINTAEVLVLGSFNPSNEEITTDFYYGRNTNYFWKSIAKVKNLDENYFLQSKDRKYEFMNKFRFCTVDIISSIEILGPEATVKSFVANKIFKECFDQTLFTSSTKYQETKIYVSRSYNREIFDMLDSGNIKNIIHTLGNSTIDRNFKTRWKERKLGESGFQGFVEKLQDTGRFNPISFSPSAIAVRSGGKDYQRNLENWLSENLKLN
jgi:hypothetical protein